METERYVLPRRFRSIETSAVMTDGRLITAHYVWPLGVGLDVYRRIDTALVRAHGTEGTRTVGTPFPEQVPDEDADRATVTPNPCIVCGKVLESAMNDSSVGHIPYEGTLFTTEGHYGSTAFDPVDGTTLSITVCDTCLRLAAAERVTFDDGRGTSGPWNPAEQH